MRQVPRLKPTASRSEGVVAAMAAERTLEQLWKSGRPGHLSPLEQLKAIAYRDVLKDSGALLHGMPGVIAAKLKKIGGPKATPCPPHPPSSKQKQHESAPCRIETCSGPRESSPGGVVTRQAVGQLLAKYDADADWYPGVVKPLSLSLSLSPFSSLLSPPLSPTLLLRPPPRLPSPPLAQVRVTKLLSVRNLHFNGTKRKCVASAAMSLKKRGLEPTYSLVVAQCPNAALNPDTNKPVDKKVIYNILREECYDDSDDPDSTWNHRPRLQKKALTAEVKEKRLAWARVEQRKGRSAGWFFRHVVWVDLCNSVLPRTEAKAKEQALARKGNKGWMSDNSAEYSRN